MALLIELVFDGVVVSGIKEWWDDIEAALRATPGDYPLLRTVDPYADVVFGRERLGELADECMRLAEKSPDRAAAHLSRLADLCQQALTTSNGFLRFVGD